MKLSSDAEALERLSHYAWTAAQRDVLQPSRKALAELGVWEAPSFRCRMWLGPDQGSLRFDSNGKPCSHPQPCEVCRQGARRLHLEFSPKPKRADSPWVIDICNRGTTERLPLNAIPGEQFGARRLRRRLHPQRAASKHIPAADRSLRIIRLSLIYVAPEMPVEDLRAQIGVALLQGGVLQEPGQSDASEALAQYLQGFSVRLPRDVTKMASHGIQQVADSVRGEVLRAIWQNWRNPEDWRAWRRYVTQHLNQTAAHILRTAGYGTMSESEDAGDYKATRPEDEGEEIRQPHRSRNPFDGGDRLSVGETADRLGMSRQRVYELIRHGKLKADPHKNVPITEVDGWERGRADRRRNRARIKELEQEGQSYDAARKRAYRSKRRGQV